MTEKKLTIPANCKECYKSQFQIEDCPYSHLKHLANAIEYFKSRGITLPLDPSGAQMLKQDLTNKCKMCMANLNERAKKVVEEQKYQTLCDMIASLNEDISSIREQIADIDMSQNNDTIFKSHQEMDDIPMKKVQTEEGPSSPPPKAKKKGWGGWKFFQVNVKKENVNQYLDKLAQKHPELKDQIKKLKAGKQSDAVSVENNNVGNKIIKYRDLK